MALNFRLFNCDHTFSLDKVETLIQRVATNLSREVNIEKTYFPLPRMKELCEELEKGGSHFEYAVFVVHAHESQLWINRAGNEGYSKLYRTLQRLTGDRVLIVIGGDDKYKDQEERDMSVLSRWALNKMCSQFTEDYINGVKSFIFSWEENHHPIHEEALEFYLPKKFVPRPKPPPAKVHEKDETKNIEQAKLLELKRQELQAADTRKRLEKEQLGHDPLLPEPKKQELQLMQTRKNLEKEFPPERIQSRVLPSRQETSPRSKKEPNVPKEKVESWPADAEIDPDKGRLRYRAQIRRGEVVYVVMSDPPDWRPDEVMLKQQLERNDLIRASLEFWEKRDGTITAVVERSDPLSRVIGMYGKALSRTLQEQS